MDASLVSALKALECDIGAFVADPFAGRLASRKPLKAAVTALRAVDREPAAQLIRDSAAAFDHSVDEGPRKVRRLAKKESRQEFRMRLICDAQSMLSLVKGLRLDTVGVALGGRVVSCPNGRAAESTKWDRATEVDDDGYCEDVLLDWSRALTAVKGHLLKCGESRELAALERLRVDLAANHFRIECLLQKLATNLGSQDRLFRIVLQSAIRATAAASTWAARHRDDNKGSQRTSIDQMLTDHQKEAREFIRQHGPISAKEIAHHFGRDESCVRRDMSKLKELCGLRNLKNRRGYFFPAAPQ